MSKNAFWKYMYMELLNGTIGREFENEEKNVVSLRSLCLKICI